MRRKLCYCVMAFSLVAAGAGAASLKAPAYHVTKTIPLGTPDRWDYVTFDPVLDRVYVSHGDSVTVVDGKSGALLGAITGIAGKTHGIASVNGLGKGYTDDSDAGIAVVFDLKTLKKIGEIKAEPDADGIVYDRQSGHILVIDGDSGKVTVVDPKTNQPIASIDGGGGLEFGASGENGKFYVDGVEKNEIVRMDLATSRADAHWPLPGCIKPHGLAIDRAHMRLFASCGNKVMVVLNADTGAALATLPIGEGTDFAMFDSAHQLAFSSNRDGTLSVIAEQSPDHFIALPPIPTELGARTMGMDPQTGRIYLVTADMSVNENTAPSDFRHRYSIKPGSVKLLFLDP
jgi:YVTN family beta-propeller protein